MNQELLFVPGRASYVEQLPDARYVLRLTESSQRRADDAAAVFDASRHMKVVFSGGYPGMAQQWPEERIPSLDRREAHLLAEPLIRRLQAAHENTLAEQVIRIQPYSDNSIGDVYQSFLRGYMSVDDFHDTATQLDVRVSAGYLHYRRFRDIFSTFLDIDPERITRTGVRDEYGTPKTQFVDAESAPVAIAKEIAAQGISRLAMRVVTPGDVETLAEAEDRFARLARAA